MLWLLFETLHARASIRGAAMSTFMFDDSTAIVSRIKMTASITSSITVEQAWWSGSLGGDKRMTVQSPQDQLANDDE